MEILKRIKDIHSVSEKEGNLLYNLARKCDGNGVIVEIGSWKGYSTICLAKGSQDGNKVPVYAIDPHTGSSVHKELYGEVNTYPIFMENITKAGVKDFVYPIVKTSEEAVANWVQPVRFLWIDGDHEKADLDFNIWYPHLDYGGWVALHDTTTWRVPKKVAMKQIYMSGNFTRIGRVGSITYAKKMSMLTERDKVLNSWAFLERRLYQLILPAYNFAKITVAKLIGRY